MPASPQTLYLRTTQSAVVSSNSSVHQLSLTKGSVSGGTLDAGINNGTSTGTWQFIPGNSANTTTIVTGSTPNSQGWFFDASAPGTYASGTWTVELAYRDTSGTGTVELLASLWVVTATASAVTSVTQVANAVASASFTNNSTLAQKTFTITGVPAITLDPNQYLYLELYLDETVAGTSGTANGRVIADDSNASIFSAIVTPNFTAAILGTTSLTLGAATISAAGTNTDHGALSATLGAATISAAGTNLDHGAVSQTLGAAYLTATAHNPVDDGALSVTLGAVTISAAGDVKDHGHLTQTLGAATVSATGTNKDHAYVFKTLGAATISATGTVVAGVTGHLFKALGAVTAVFTGTVSNPGTLSATLGSLGISAQGLHPGAALLFFHDDQGLPLPSGITVSVYNYAGGVMGSIIGTAVTNSGGMAAINLPNGPTAEYIALFSGSGSPTTPQSFGPEVGLPMYLDQGFDLDAGFLLDGTRIGIAGFSLVPPFLLPIVVPLLPNNASPIPPLVVSPPIQIGTPQILLIVSPGGSFLSGASCTLTATDPNGVNYSWGITAIRNGAFAEFVMNGLNFNVPGKWSCQLAGSAGSATRYTNVFNLHIVNTTNVSS